jgi:DNA-directed RNA polymerase subunit RPC12/RpoP
MSLRIVGDVPVYAMREPPTIKITLNGELVDQFVPTKRELDKTFSVPAARLGNADTCELRFTSSNFFIPADYHKNSTDDRRMCFRIFQLTWSAKDGMPDMDAGPVKGVPINPQPDPAIPKIGLQSWLWAGLISAIVATIVLVLAVAMLVYIRRRPDAPIAEDPQQPADKSLTRSFACTECGKNLKVKVEMTGRKVKCPHCRKTLITPASIEVP